MRRSSPSEFLRRHLALRRALLRALLRALGIYIPLRITLVAVSISGHGNGAAIPTADNSPGIILLMSLLGFIDIRVRREELFWSNLGYGRWHLCALFGTIALIGETMVSFVRQ